MENMKSTKEFLDKIKSYKESDKIDLSSKEDLAIGIMNLISIEEHLFFTYEKTKKEKYLNMANEVREMRKKYLAMIVKNPEGEIWCISKHLLAASMRLIEVGTKKNNENKKEEAKDLFDNAFNLWNLFWGLNLDLIGIDDIKQNEETDIKLEKGQKTSIFSGLGRIINKILDCCRE
ncbi:MAG: hypothetical protein PHI53_01220 [Candidatus Pacebacteria bacterium]|nr:hypothetical protein [Candidatus Paceibacterota bacterium]